MGGGCGGKGYSDIGLAQFWGVQNFECQYFWGFSEKNDYLLGYEDFVDILWGHHKSGLF